MNFTQAIVRLPSPQLGNGLTTSADLGVPDYPLALSQHQRYCELLQKLGAEIISLEAVPDFPDAYFVEDTAIFTPEVAVICRPGAAARRGEAALMKPVAARFRPILEIEAPGTLDGGDVLLVDRHFFIGLSERTNMAGAEQFAGMIAAYEYHCSFIPVGKGLHFKSSVNHAGGNRLLLTAEFAGHEPFAAYEQIIVPAEEAYAANCLWFNEHLIMADGFPKTAALLQEYGVLLQLLDMSEIAKMDGGLTCLSLRF